MLAMNRAFANDLSLKDPHSGKPSGRPRLANYRAHLLMLGKVKVLSYYPKAISKRLHNISCALEPEVVTSSHP